MSLIDVDSDWIERVRKYWYPRLHKYLPQGFYSKGHVGWHQYTGCLAAREDTIEAELSDIGFTRNPIAAYKSLPDGRQSEGSWVLWHEHRPQIVDPGMQLHVTLFQPPNGGKGREVYAHCEDDWRASPIAHLRSKNFTASVGVGKCRALLDAESYLVLDDRRRYTNGE